MNDEKMKPIAFLKGVRVALRPTLREDLPKFFRWMNDIEVTQYLMSFLPMTESDEEAWYESLSESMGKDIHFAVTTIEGELIGGMGIHKIDWRSRFATTGAFIGNAEYRDSGLGTEAKMLLLEYAFNTLNLRKICSHVIAFNERSLAYLAKQGYVEVGRLKEHHYAQGQYWDEVILEVFREDWMPIYEEFVSENFGDK